MRVRPIAALSIAAAAALLLAGCSGGATPDDTATTATSLCDAVADSGTASDAVEVSGELGQMPTVTFTAPLEFDALESTVITKGEGEKVAEGDFVEYAVSAYDAQSGSSAGGQEFNVSPIMANTVLGGAFGCAPIGTRVAVTLPATDSTTTPAVYVIDLLGTVPGAAWGEEQPAVDGFPQVTLDDDGAPTISLPGTDAPTEVQIATLKQGDGATVASGDWVAVQYSGVKWSDGTVFDSSWDRGSPSAFQTTGVVPGFQQALEGATVGSQILVVIPPEFGYGTDPSASSGLGGETLVFVIDVLDTHPTTWQ